MARQSTGAGGADRPPVDLPYVDRVLAQLEAGHPDVRRAFGRHLHWGYWPDPAGATGSAPAYAAAADRLALEVCAAAGVADGARLLDVGCGFGGTLALLNERHAGMALTGLNVDARQLALAAAAAEPRAGNRLALVRGDAGALPFAAASFDVVLAVESIFHFRDRATFLREAARVLRPGGRLALTDFVPFRYLHYRSGSFFGPINLRCSAPLYRQLARDAGLAPRLERDLTAETLPTYRVLRRLERSLPWHPSARLQARLLEWATRLGVVRYMLLAYSVATPLGARQVENRKRRNDETGDDETENSTA